MQPRTPKLRDEIRDAAAFIAETTHGLTEDEYRRNRMLRQSVERNFEIIGGAMRRLTQHAPDTARRISSYAQIISFRNSLIHGYDVIDHSAVWQVIQRDVPTLLIEVTALLGTTHDDA
jgi:uncharacterized protein with HEPN domain